MMPTYPMDITVFNADESDRAVVYIDGKLHSMHNHVSDAAFVWELLGQFRGQVIGEFNAGRYLKEAWFDPAYRANDWPMTADEIPPEALSDQD